MSSNDPFPGYTEIKVAAERGPKSLFTLRRWVREGRIRAYKWGHTVYLKDEDLVPKPMPQPQRRINGK